MTPAAAVSSAANGRTDLAPQLEYFEDEDETTWWKLVAAYSLVLLLRENRLPEKQRCLRRG